MRLLLVLLLLGGCTATSGSDQPSPGSVNFRLNGSYTAFGGTVIR